MHRTTLERSSHRAGRHRPTVPTRLLWQPTTVAGVLCQDVLVATAPLLLLRVWPPPPLRHSCLSSAPALVCLTSSLPTAAMQATHARNLLFWMPKPPIKSGQVVMVTGAGSGIGLNVSWAQRGGGECAKPASRQRVRSQALTRSSRCIPVLSLAGRTRIRHSCIEADPDRP